MQLTFGDAEGLGQRKRTRREIFLIEMEQVVPWKALLGLIEPHYPKMGCPGRQPYPLATMLRIHFLQHWYALSDPGMEEALYEIPSLRRFAQLGGRDAISDETTILNFRRLLETHGLAHEKLSKLRAMKSKRERHYAKRWEHYKASVRAKVEHPFRVIKRQFGYVKMRYRGMAKNEMQVLTLFALSNLWMARRHL